MGSVLEVQAGSVGFSVGLCPILESKQSELSSRILVRQIRNYGIVIK